MSYLATFGKGRQNEHLGLFILSRFVFVANPVTVSDDLVSDFFCNLFTVKRCRTVQYLEPHNAFSIQIKSSNKIFDVTNKIAYLWELELPYFVGVVDQSKLSLTIYSGEFLPLFFAKVGIPERMRIELVDGSVTPDDYHRKYGHRKYRVYFPQVTTIQATIEDESLKGEVDDLKRLCSRMHENLATRRSEEHIYTVGDSEQVRIVAGSGSAKVFRDNFYKRLAEVFFNFFWIVTKEPSKFDIDEYLIYKKLRSDLRKCGKKMPDYVEKAFKKSEEAVAGLSRKTGR